MRVKLSVAASFLALSAIATHLPSALAVDAPTAPVPVTVAVYRGPGPWGSSKIPAYESFLGRPVAYALDFQDTDTVSNQTWPNWQADAWRQAGKTVILGTTGVWPGTGSWAQAARGDYDAHWRTLGERLVATGQAGAVLRGAHEFNGGWFPWRVQPGQQADFIAAWRRWVTIMRSIPGQRFSFDWNPTVGVEQLTNPESAYPGDDYVTRIALDVYDGWYPRGWRPGIDAPPTTAERDAMWNEILNGSRGLRFWRAFAESRGKRLSLPEWGLRLWDEGSGFSHGGGDNVAFIERMHAIISDPAWRIDYHAFWEHEGNGVSDPDGARFVNVPNARAAFLRLFGGAAPTPTTTTTAPVTTTTAPATTTTKAPALTTTTTAPATTTTAAPVTTTTAAPVTTTPTSTTTSTTTSTSTGSSWAAVRYSRWQDRSWEQPLSKAIVSGNLFVFVRGENLRSVRFYLDDPHRRRPPLRVDSEAPFDLVGGNQWLALPLDTATLTVGSHKLTTEVFFTDGSMRRWSVPFTVTR
jgi:hypothetical protein